MTYDAAAKKDSGERVAILESGMAKGSSPARCAFEVTLEAMRIHGGYGYIKRVPGGGGITGMSPLMG